MPRTGAFPSAQLDFCPTPSSEIAGRPFETVSYSTQAPPHQRGFFVSDDSLAHVGRRRALSAYTQTYAYDSGWNLDYRKVDGVTEQFSTNGTNELTSSPLGSASYDSNGNLTDDGNTEYNYDHANSAPQRAPGTLATYPQ